MKKEWEEKDSNSLIKTRQMTCHMFLTLALKISI